MRADPSEFPPEDEGLVRFDYTFTSDEAARIIDVIPGDSYHWRDIPRKRPGAVARYTHLMRGGKWRDQTFEHGFFEHPIRFNLKGEITHGVMRLLACRDSGVSFRAAVVAPSWMEMLDASAIFVVDNRRRISQAATGR